MIKTFASKMVEHLFDGVSSRYTRKFSNKLHSIAIRKLDQLNAVTKVESLNIPPNNRLEKLKGNLENYWSIRINKQYRIIFRWIDSDSYDVDIVDYH